VRIRAVIGVMFAVGLLLVSTALAATISGSARSETLRGTNAADVIRAKAGNDRAYGRNGNDRLYGQNGNDRLYGQNGNDRLYGQNGNDRLYGQKGNDRVVGGPGNDLLTGGPGRDIHLGGPGNDRILARDRTRDVVNCGAGRDVAIVDDQDRVVGCERVRRIGGRARQPGPRGGLTPPSQPAPAPATPPAPAPPSAPSTTDQMLALLRGQVLTLIETNNSSPGTGFSDRSTLDLCSDGTFAYRREYSASFGGGAGDATVEEATGASSTCRASRRPASPSRIRPARAAPPRAFSRFSFPGASRSVSCSSPTAACRPSSNRHESFGHQASDAHESNRSRLIDVSSRCPPAKAVRRATAEAAPRTRWLAPRLGRWSGRGDSAGQLRDECLPCGRGRSPGIRQSSACSRWRLPHSGARGWHRSMRPVKARSGRSAQRGAVTECMPLRVETTPTAGRIPLPLRSRRVLPVR